jgi:hypothetical protein
MFHAISSACLTTTLLKNKSFQLLGAPELRFKFGFQALTVLELHAAYYNMHAHATMQLQGCKDLGSFF